MDKTIISFTIKTFFLQQQNQVLITLLS